MLLDNDSIKFKLNNTLYTVQLTDNSDMKLSVKLDDKIYYIADVNEVINNLKELQRYDDKVSLYYKYNDELIKIGIRECIMVEREMTENIIYNVETSNNFICNNILAFKDGICIERIDDIHLEDNLTHIEYNSTSIPNFTINIDIEYCSEYISLSRINTDILKTTIRYSSIDGFNTENISISGSIMEIDPDHLEE